MSASIKRLFILLAIALVLAGALANSSAVLAQEDDHGNAPYRVLNGDTLTKIARRFGLTVEKLLIANPQITNPNVLLTGQMILLPPGRSEGLSLNAPKGRLIHWQLERDGRRIDKEEGYYLVRSGDTLIGIAKKFGVKYDRLLAANPQIEDENVLFRGELVKIPEGRSEFAPPFYGTPAKPPTG
jgi:peptidoglycan endopeptidase LytE